MAVGSRREVSAIFFLPNEGIADDCLTGSRITCRLECVVYVDGLGIYQGTPILSSSFVSYQSTGHRHAPRERLRRASTSLPLYLTSPTVILTVRSKNTAAALPVRTVGRRTRCVRIRQCGVVRQPRSRARRYRDGAHRRAVVQRESIREGWEWDSPNLSESH
jgi:hypothetical protein